MNLLAVLAVTTLGATITTILAALAAVTTLGLAATVLAVTAFSTTIFAITIASRFWHFYIMMLDYFLRKMEGFDHYL
jgi:uncharacterized membrane protein YphA (DoxX/SURF4 family)